MTITTEYLINRLRCVEEANWDEADGLTGGEIWGRLASPEEDCNYYNYRSAVRHALAPAKSAAEALRVARTVGISSDDLMYELENAAHEEAYTQC